MKTFLIPLIPLLALSGAGVSAQTTAVPREPKASDALVYTDVPQKQSPKSTPQPPLQYRIVPTPPPGSRPLLLTQPRFTMPVKQHDLSLYPMPVTEGKGLPVRIPVAPPVLPKDPR